MLVALLAAIYAVVQNGLPWTLVRRLPNRAQMFLIAHVGVHFDIRWQEGRMDFLARGFPPHPTRPPNHMWSGGVNPIFVQADFYDTNGVCIASIRNGCGTMPLCWETGMRLFAVTNGVPILPNDSKPASK